MDTDKLAQIEADARDLLAMVFLNDNVDSETYIKTHELYISIAVLNAESRSSKIKRLFRK